MIILGIDPGSRITGYGLLEKKGSQIKHLDNGAIFCGHAPTFADRLVLLFQKIQALITEFHPEVISLEKIFIAKNVSSTLKLGHARGAIMVATSLTGAQIAEYTPLEIKQAVVGYGRASKEQVQKMVKTLLNLPQIAEENASDALAVALCHAYSEKMNHFLKK